MANLNQLSLAAQDVRRFDRDRFQTVFFAPPDRRESLFTLYAFNVELSRIQSQVREPLLGQIRLQWWRDSLDLLFRGQPVAHPLGQSLVRLVEQHQLRRTEFEQLLDSRVRELDACGPADLTDYLDDAAGSAVPLNALALQILGVPDPAAQQAARHTGMAWGLTGALRNVPYRAESGRVTLPPDLLMAQAITAEDILNGRQQDRLQAVARQLVACAGEHLAKARQVRGSLPRAAQPVLLQAVLTDLYLRKLASCQYNLFDRNWSRPHPHPLRLAIGYLLNRF